MTLSSSSHTSQSDNDVGRHKRVRVSPQVAEAPVPMQPLEPTNINPVNIQPVNIQPVSIGQDVSENLAQINEVFWLLPEELCPKTQQEHTPAKPLSGIEQLTGSFLRNYAQKLTGTHSCKTPFWDPFWDRTINGITLLAITCSTPV